MQCYSGKMSLKLPESGAKNDQSGEENRDAVGIKKTLRKSNKGAAGVSLPLSYLRGYFYIESEKSGGVSF